MYDFPTGFPSILARRSHKEFTMPATAIPVRFHLRSCFLGHLTFCNFHGHQFLTRIHKELTMPATAIPAQIVLLLKYWLNSKKDNESITKTLSFKYFKKLPPKLWSAKNISKGNQRLQESLALMRQILGWRGVKKYFFGHHDFA